MKKPITDLGFVVAHIGINCPDEQSAAVAGAKFSGLFGFPVKNGSSSVFASKEIELLKKPGYGSNGHIAVKTSDIDEAIRYLKEQGVAFIEETITRNAEGEIVRIFLREEIEGFAIHLLRT